MGNICFELIQVSVGTRMSMSRELTDVGWRQLFSFCQRQALLGIGFSGVEQLYKQGVECPIDLRLKWYGYVLQIEKLNRKLNVQCREIVGRMEDDGLQCCILKGQSYQAIYPENLRERRMPGDIDVWCVVPKEGSDLVGLAGNDYSKYCGHEAVRQYVRQQCRIADVEVMPKACYHHIDAPDIDGTHVEVHYRPAFLHSPIRNRRMQRWFSYHADECMKNGSQLDFPMLTPSVNVVYQMCHLYAHVFESGLGFRQLMDFYFTLKAWCDDVMECKPGTNGDESVGVMMSADEIMLVLRSFGIVKFAGAVMYVLHEVFAMSDKYFLCEPNEKEGRRLLADIMRGGNFGQHDTRDVALRTGGMIKHGIWKLKRVMRLVRSYPEEALWEPVFRVYHLFWRIAHK